MNSPSRVAPFVLAFGVVATAFAAAAQGRAPQAGQPGGMGMHGGMMHCPAGGVPGFKAETVDTKDGASLTFTADEDYADALRAHAYMLAAMQSGRVRETWGMPGAPLPDANATVEVVKGGARVSFSARHRSQVDAVRSAVRKLASNAQQGGCPMACCGMGSETMGPGMMGPK